MAGGKGGRKGVERESIADERRVERQRRNRDAGSRRSLQAICCQRHAMREREREARGRAGKHKAYGMQLLLM